MKELRVYRQKQSLRRGEEHYYYRIVNDNPFEDGENLYNTKFKCEAKAYYANQNFATKVSNSQIAILEYKVCEMTEDLLNRLMEIQIATKKEEFESELSYQLTKIKNEFNELKDYYFLLKYVGKKVYKFNVEGSGDYYDDYVLYSDIVLLDGIQLNLDNDTIDMNYEIVQFEEDLIQDNLHYFEGIVINNLIGIF